MLHAGDIVRLTDEWSKKTGLLGQGKILFFMLSHRDDGEQPRFDVPVIYWQADGSYRSEFPIEALEKVGRVRIRKADMPDVIVDANGQFLQRGDTVKVVNEEDWPASVREKGTVMGFNDEGGEIEAVVSFPSLSNVPIKTKELVKMGIDKTAKTKYTGNMDTDFEETALMPDVVADSVAEEFTSEINKRDSETEYARHLMDRFRDVYQNNQDWAEKIVADTDNSRSMLYSFMFHWAAAYAIDRGDMTPSDAMDYQRNKGVMSSVKTAASYRLNPYAEISGTERRGSLTATYAELEAAFGPAHAEGDKSNFEWFFSDDQGHTFTIYDFDAEEVSAEDRKQDGPHEWSVGAYYKVPVEDFIQWVQSQL